MKDWTLDILIKRFDSVTNLKTKQLQHLGDTDYQQLLLNIADKLFDEGRYSVKTEWTLEMFDLDSANEALNDLTQVTALTDSQRQRLAFYKDLKHLCYPLFAQKPCQLELPPFAFTDKRFSIKNQELRNFLFDTPHRHLGLVICNALVQTYWNDEKLLDTIITNELQSILPINCHTNDEKADNERYEHIISAIIQADNHLEIGTRLGLTPTAQALYDMVDTFICREYDYQQVDFAIEMGAWIENHWPQRIPHPAEEQKQALVSEFERLAEKYHILCEKNRTLNYIFLDLLGCSLFSEEELSYDDFDDLSGYNYE